MNVKQKINALKKLLEKSTMVTVEDSSDPNFKAWKNLVERTFIKVFGKESTEFEHFEKLEFYYPAIVFTASTDYTNDHLRVFREDYKILIDSINQYIEELQEEEDTGEKAADDLKTVKTNGFKKLTRIFISHSSKDANFVEEIIDLLEAIGIESTQIFCSSFEGYGLDLGDNFLDVIKDELSSDCLVLFLISENFNKSPVCLCEMGATWVLTKEHIPILIPPVDYSNIKGVLPSTQGLKINEPLKFNLLKEKIEKLFNLKNKTSMSTWERKRDRVLARIEDLITK